MECGIIAGIRKKKPLIHCITNYVTANDVANIILAAGGSAVMADGEREVEDVTSICQGLVINMGTLKEETIPAMIKAGKKAAALGHPIVFDPVGAGASYFRTESCRKVFEEVRVSLVRGNVSEIRALAGVAGQLGTMGVDASGKDRVTEENLRENIRFAEDFAGKHGIMVLMTGHIDIATDGKRTFLVRNGTPLMTRITGAGCMLDGLAAVFLAASPDKKDIFAAALAAAAEGYCGEQAEKKIQEEEKRFPDYPAGTGSFRVYLIDKISRLSDNELKEGIKIEAC